MEQILAICPNDVIVHSKLTDQTQLKGDREAAVCTLDIIIWTDSTKPKEPKV